MRILYDMQPSVTESRDRGIGRYAENLAIAMIEEAARRGNIESLLAYDGIDKDRLREARSRLRAQNIGAPSSVYTYPHSTFTDIEPERVAAAARVRGRFFEALAPDVYVQFSYFETWFNYTAEIAWHPDSNIRKAVVAHDLIPLIYPEHYLADPFIAEWFPRRCREFREQDLLLANSQSTGNDLVSLLDVPRERIKVIGAGLDAGLLAASRLTPPRDDKLLKSLGIREPFVLVVSNGDWRKNTLGAIDAFAKLPKAIRNEHQLVLTKVGDDVLHALSKGHLRSVADRVLLLNRVDDTVLAELYRRCAVFFFPSLYEGFGLPVLEAMAFGAPVLSSDRGALPEVVHDQRCLFNPEDQEQVASLLAKTLEDSDFRAQLANGAAEHARSFTWAKCAAAALDALAELPQEGAQPSSGRLKLEKDDVGSWADFVRSATPEALQALDSDLRAAASVGVRRILVDVTCIAEFDARSGIQRVVRNFCTHLHDQARESGLFEIQPIYWTAEYGIRYANEFSRDSLGLSQPGEDVPVVARANDLLFMLDSAWVAPERFEPLYGAIWAAGGEVVWMVYDLIPILIPHTCHEGMPPAFARWLSHVVPRSDGFVCISEATRMDLERYIDQQGPMHRRPWTRSVHLGSDLDADRVGLPTKNILRLLETLAGIPPLVAVGTLEPRKDHATILDAFDRIWRQGEDAALVIVGKPGWNIEALAQRIGQHPENNKRLFWLKNISDGDLAHLMENSAALIQASLSEGFGLPIVEAGSKGVSLLLSDIPVFREVAGPSASYFPVGDSRALAELVTHGLKNGFARPEQGSIATKTWREVTTDLVDRLLA